MTSVCTVPGTSAGICRDALQFAVPGGKCGKFALKCPRDSWEIRGYSLSIFNPKCFSLRSVLRKR